MKYAQPQMSAQATAHTKHNLFAFSPIAEKGLQKHEMTTPATAHTKHHLFPFSPLAEKKAFRNKKY